MLWVRHRRIAASRKQRLRGFLLCCGEEFGCVAQAMLAVCINLQDVGIAMFLSVFQAGFDRCAFAAVDGAVKDIKCRLKPKPAIQVCILRVNRRPQLKRLNQSRAWFGQRG